MTDTGSSWAKCVKVLTVGAIVALTGCGNPPRDFQHLDALIEDARERSHMSAGTAIVVLEDNRIVHEAYFGLEDVGAGKPVNEDTVFYIASTTKAFLALAVLLAESRGEISEDTTLQELFPDLAFPSIDAERITVRHLLTHTSGIDNEPLTWSMSYTGLHTPAEKRMTMIAASYPSEGANLGEFEYSNIGYNILAVWMDRHYGRDWRTVLEDTVVAPLEMSRTTGFISVAADNAWPLAKPYSYKVGGGREELYLRKTDDTMYSVGLLATARDTARFVLATMNDGEIDGQPVFPVGVIEKQRTRQIETEGGYFDGYAWGWMTTEQHGRPLMLHTGGFSGATAAISYMPEKKIGLVVLHNENGLKANVLNSIAQKAAYGTALGLSDESVHSEVANTIDWLEQASSDARTKLTEQQEARMSKAWNLSLPVSAFAGVYAHPHAGEIVVEQSEDERLALSWGLLLGTGYPADEKDRIVVDFRPGSFDDLSFVVEGDEISGLFFNGVYFER